tara:strand:+ start:260 stop:631 length:372 start_codon:yes stop_codon:yes gene_type:complete
MKKLLFVSLFLLGSYTQLSAQTVNGISVEDIPAKYVEIVATTKMFKMFKVTVYLDYGQIGKMKEIKKGHIIGDDGKIMSFNGVMGALNVLNEKGFKYISQYAITEGNASVYHLLLENTNYKKE